MALTAVEDGPALDLDGLVGRTGAPRVLVEAVEREGLLLPHHLVDGVPRYTAEDAEALRAGLRLVELGLPLPELISLGHRTDDAMREVADAAVDAFQRYIRDAAVAEEDPDVAADRLLHAYRTMLPSAVHVVAHRLRRLLMTTAAARFSAEPDAEGPADGS